MTDVQGLLVKGEARNCTIMHVMMVTSQLLMGAGPEDPRRKEKKP